MKGLRSLRRIAMFGLILAIMLASAAPAYANGKGKGHGNGPEKIKHEHATKKDKRSKEIKLEFEDVWQEADWAQKYIASLAAKKVFEGYDDGKFRPNKPVSRIEAIVAAVRLMGLREEAEDKDMLDEDIDFDDERHIRKAHGWAVGYIVVAQEEGLLDNIDGKLQPEKPATRLWVTELLVRALELEDEAEDKMDAKLDFRDHHEIPRDKVGFVKVAVDEGFMNGYPNGKFQPNKPVTRAELAAMLERAEGRLIEAGDEAARGTVVREVRDDTLVLEQKGQTNRYELDPDAFIFRNGKKVSADALQRGDVVFIRSYNDVVIFVEVLRTAEEDDSDDDGSFEILGELQSFLLNERGQLDTLAIRHTVKNKKQISVFRVSSEVRIRGDLELFTPGEDIVIYGDEKTIKRIVIED